MNRPRIAATSAFAVIAMACASAGAQTPAPAEPPAAATALTRARVASFYEEAGNKSYVRLQLLPGKKLPFMTHTFRVRDRSLLADIPKGAWVKFSASRVDGENVLTAIHVVPACVRFQPCD